MSDLTGAKDAIGSALPDNAIETSLNDVEPLVTPEQVRKLHLFGIPLVSALKNPLTGKPDVMDDVLLKRFIDEAVSLAEMELGLTIFERTFDERQPFDKPQSDSWGYMILRHRPCQKLISVEIKSSDNVVLWKIPNAWISPGFMHSGQINVIPLATINSDGTAVATVGPTGLGLLPSLFRFHWVPSLWAVKYVAGFASNQFPKVINQLIGTIAAMEVLSLIAATFRNNSSSLSIDGLSQSVSTSGPHLWDLRLQELGEKRKWLVSKVKRNFGLGFFSDNV